MTVTDMKNPAVIKTAHNIKHNTNMTLNKLKINKKQEYRMQNSAR